MEQKLSEEDVDILWKRFKENGEDDVRDDILLYYMSLVKWIVQRIMPRVYNYIDYDDLVCCGIIGLSDALTEYNPEQDIKFETFAADRIRAEILDYINAMDWATPELREKINALNLAIETNLKIEVPTVEKLLEDKKKSILIEVIDELPTKERAIFTLYYYEDWTYNDIAKHFCVTEAYVEETHNNVLMKMRARLDSQNLLS